MILSNTEIVRCIDEKLFSITPLLSRETDKPPFNSSAIDLRLGDEILIPNDTTPPVQLDLSKPGIADYLLQNSKPIKITPTQPYTLLRNKLILAKTLETVNFPLTNNPICYSARVEGRSSLARCGILVHFTAPTIHAGFTGTITLEIINLGSHDFLLKPEMFICQLIIEEVKGTPNNNPSQFHNQNTAAGTIS